MINMILGLSKTYNDSFIAQSIPMRKEWIIELCKEIQANTGASDWKHGILSKISPSLGISPFSEYETIGTYAMNRLTIPNRPIPQASPRQWLRTGYEIIGPASNFKFFHHPAFADAAFVSFERSSKPFSYYSNTQMIIPALSVKSKLLTRAKNLLSLAYHTLRINLDSARISLRKLTLPVSLQSQRNESEEEKVERFLSEFFPASPLSCIVQVGANDGISNDPLRPFLPQHKGAVVLIEALPHYCDKLNDLYSTQSNVGIVNALIAAKEGERTFYYINPGVADEMDGDGPMNRWAHGQGCFSKETIISWIQQNSFRGITYRKNLQRYVESIESTSLKSVTLATLANQRQLSQIHLLVIDVQGAEMDVLSSLGELANLPSFIIYEDDSSLNPHDSKALELLLIDYGYVYIAGCVNRLWGLDSPTVSRDSLGFNS
jgi:FkbM family methyltransferase